MPYIEVIKTLYQLGLYPNKGVKDYFFLPDNFNVQGIYCFLSKDSLSYYIGSLISMKTRYNRHLFNFNQSNTKYFQANSKFYNYLNK